MRWFERCVMFLEVFKGKLKQLLGIVGGSFWNGFGVEVEFVCLALLVDVDLTFHYEKAFVFLEVGMGEIFQNFAVEDGHMRKHKIFIEFYVAFFMDYFEDGKFGVVGERDA